MPETPTVFVSYSHDSPAHKQWVAELATRLRKSGINAVLDQWDLSLGDDVTRFMEEGVTGSDRVLVVCTDNYIRKADAGQGGVGYERLIVTAELVSNLGTKKFIPIVRNVTAETKTPIFLATRLYIDFSDDDSYDAKLEELLRELHKAPSAVKPPLGKNPFAVTQSGEGIAEPEQSEKSVNIPTDFLDASEVYRSAVELARLNDLYGWRQLIKRARRPAQDSLSVWKSKYEKVAPLEGEDFGPVVDEAVTGISPLLVIALTGVESGRDEFKDQRDLVDELYHPEGWPQGGYTKIVDLPTTLVYVYQALHGAVCTLTGQLEVAVALADTKIKDKSQGQLRSLWRLHDIVGWPKSLGGNCLTAWQYITSAITRWPWLAEIFGSERDYRTSLAAYYMALNVYELVTDIAEGRAANWTPDTQARMFVPLMFTFETDTIQQRALSLLLRNKQSVSLLWERRSVSRENMEKLWPIWISFCNKWAISVRNNFFHRNIGHEDLFKLLDR